MNYSKLRKLMFEKLSQSNLPSTTIAITNKDEVIWSGAVGFRDLENKLPATPETLYGIGSVTKSFTALAIMQLVQQGKLSVDDPVEKYIDFPIKPKGGMVLIKHFLTHTCGIPALAISESIIRYMTGAEDNWMPIADYTDLHAFLQGSESWATHKPGERWFYFNEGYILLGEIIEKCSGQPYWEYLQEHILKPLGMQRTFFLEHEVQADPNAAVPYSLNDDGSRRASTYPYSHINAKGGIVSNVHDMASYVRMYLNQGSGILNETSMQEMQIPRIHTPAKNGAFGDPFYAYGLRVTPDFLGHKLVGHGGSVLVATAFMGFLPEEGLGVVVLSNGSGYSMEQFGLYALATALGEDPDQLPFIQHEKMMNEIAGTYETFKGTMRVKVKKAGDMLMLVMKDRFHSTSVPLIPKWISDKKRVFHYLQGGAQIEVEFSLDEQSVHLLFERYGLRKIGK